MTKERIELMTRKEEAVMEYISHTFSGDIYIYMERENLRERKIE